MKESKKKTPEEPSTLPFPDHAGVIAADYEGAFHKSGFSVAKFCNSRCPGKRENNRVSRIPDVYERVIERMKKRNGE